MNSADNPAPAVDATHPKADEKKSTKVGVGLLLQLVTAAALILVAGWWCEQHVGRPISALPGAAYVIGFFGVLSALFVLIGLKAERNSLVAKIMRFFISWPMLVVATLLLAATVLLLASIVVTSEGAAADADAGPPTFTVTRATDSSESEWARESTAGRVALMPLLPWGRSYVVKMKGYRPEPVRLYPWTGARVAKADLDVIPSLVIRVPHDRMPLLAGGRVELWQRTDGDWTMIGKCATAKGAAAVRFGFEREVPAGHDEDWRAALAGDGIDGEMADIVVGCWRTPLTGDVPDLDKGMELEARFLFESGPAVLACRRFTTTAKEINDVLLTSIFEESDACVSP